MYTKKNETIYLIVSIIGFLIFSISFLLMPVETTGAEQGPNAVTVVAGIMFWIGLLVGVIAQICLSASRKNWFNKNKVRLPLSNQPKLGLITFFRNKTAIGFDVLLIISLVGLIVSIALTNATGYGCYIFLALTTFSFCSHCIFNGKNYYFIENKGSIKKAIEKSKADTTK